MSDKQARPIALRFDEVPVRSGSRYPAEFAPRVAAREKYVLGDPFGLTGFGVNRVRLPPGAQSALRHAHTHEDEWIYVLEGTPVLITDAGEMPLAPGLCAGFKAGSGDAHHLVNRSDADVFYLEVGARNQDDAGTYPDDDMCWRSERDGGGFFHHDGTPYPKRR